MDDPQSQGATPSRSKLPWREHPEKATHIAVVVLGVLTITAGLWLLALNMGGGPSNDGSPVAMETAPVPAPSAPAPPAPVPPSPAPTTPAAVPAAPAPAPSETKVANPTPDTAATHEVYNTRRDREAPWLMLRAEPNPQAAERYAMQDGTQLNILGTDFGAKGTWWRVRIVGGESDGTTGYAHSRWIRTVAER